MERSEISDIEEGSDGKVLLRFNSSRGFRSRFPTPSSSRNSFSESFYSAKDSISGVYHRRTNTLDPAIKVEFSGPIPTLIIDHVREQSPPMSPTQSDMGRYSSINVIIRENFLIDKDYLRKDLILKNIELKRNGL